MTKERVANQAKDLVNAYKTAFATDEGQIVLWDLMKNSNMLCKHYSGDVNTMLLNEGKRELVLSILAKINTDPVDLLKRIQEGYNREERYVNTDY